MPENRLKTIMRASITAIIVNAALAVFKAIVGILTNSIAITMDAVNNFTDAGSSLITMISSYLAAKDPDKKHPFGYGRLEYLGTLVIAGLILYAGVTALVESVKQIINPGEAEYTAVSLFIIAVAVLGKFLLMIYTTNVGKKTNSDSLIAAGKEAIGDVLVSLATLVAAFIFILFHVSVEAYLGALISILIIKSGVEILQETIGKILGTAGDVMLLKDIKKTITSYDGIHGAYDVVLHNYGPDTYLASAHVEVNDTMTVNDFDIITRKIQEEVFDKHGVFLTALGVYSINTQDEEIIRVREDVKSIAVSNPMVRQLHGFYMDSEKKYMRFDLVISFDAKDRTEVYNSVLAEVKERYPDYEVSAGMDTDYNELS
ncbi:MAG: cation diffusion facilitator family transporter [Lachnospiraceae bacterium]|nr:cation diffusion facilitator family transporter [Lachnospiraceae bacterium]